MSNNDNEKKCSPKLAENHLLAFIGPKSLPAHAGGRVKICLTSCKTMPATGGWQRAKKRKSSGLSGHTLGEVRSKMTMMMMVMVVVRGEMDAGLKSDH